METDKFLRGVSLGVGEFFAHTQEILAFLLPDDPRNSDSWGGNLPLLAVNPVIPP